MFRVRLLLGYLLVGVLTASAASADTGGQPWDRSPPWSAIGRVQRGAAGPCSGILIAPDKALTVAHCAGDPGSPQGLTFVTKTQAYKVTKILTASGAATAGGNAQLDQLRRDWAILTLTRSGSGTPPPPATFAGLPAARAVYLASDQLAKAGTRRRTAGSTSCAIWTAASSTSTRRGRSSSFTAAAAWDPASRARRSSRRPRRGGRSSGPRVRSSRRTRRLTASP